MGRVNRSRIIGYGAAIVASGAVWAGVGCAVAKAEDARAARLPQGLWHVPTIKAIYPELWTLEQARNDGVRWNRLRRAAREAWMRSHSCATATLERRYRTGWRSGWETVLATWRCDGTPSWYVRFLTCATGHEGGSSRMDVWYGGSTGWQGGRFAGSDRVVGPLQVRPYHASKVAPQLAGRDRTVTYETFAVITDPVNHARIGERVGVGAFAATTRAACS